MARSSTFFALPAITALTALTFLAGCDSPASDPRPVGVPTQTESGSPRLNPPDGGQKYFDKFANTPFGSNSDSFPIGVWFESVTGPEDVETDRRAGINLYVALTADSDLKIVSTGGMHAVLQADEWSKRAQADESPAVAGWLLSDEIDMNDGYPKGIKNLRTILGGLPTDGRFRFNNYGKGVMPRMERAAAAEFVNSQDVVSADTYWFTDSNLCTEGEGGRWLTGEDRDLTTKECRLAANYGRTVQYLRSLVSPPGSKPVWAFIEVGHPAGEDDWPTIKPAEVRAAVWSSIIGGARGVVYFNHSFGGPAQTQHVLREPAYARIRSTVTSVNKQIADLATVLNLPTITGTVSSPSGINFMTKYTRRSAFIFSASANYDQQLASITMKCAGNGQADVLGENRSITFKKGEIRDQFADGNAVHIYRLPLSSACRSQYAAASAGD